MIDFFNTYQSEEFLSFLISLSPLFVVGVLLAVIAWIASYLIYAAFALFKK